MSRPQRVMKTGKDGIDRIRCGHCNTWLPLSSFYASGNELFGRTHTCIPCLKKKRDPFANLAFRSF